MLDRQESKHFVPIRMHNFRLLSTVVLLPDFHCIVFCHSIPYSYSENQRAMLSTSN